MFKTIQAWVELGELLVSTDFGQALEAFKTVSLILKIFFPGFCGASVVSLLYSLHEGTYNSRTRVWVSFDGEIRVPQNKASFILLSA